MKWSAVTLIDDIQSNYRPSFFGGEGGGGRGELIVITCKLYPDSRSL